MTRWPWFLLLSLLVTGSAASCHDDRSSAPLDRAVADAAATPDLVDAFAPPGQLDASTEDASPRDARADAPADAMPAPSKLTVHPRQGAAEDDPTAPAGPALVLDSGASAATVFGWMQGALFTEPHGDLVVLNASSGDPAAGVLGAASFRSVQTLSLGDDSTPADFAAAAAILQRAEAIWFEGGDQARYVRWKDTALMAAVQATYVRGGALGGSSAGMIILGQAVNDALSTLSENLTTARLLRDPFDPDLHFTRDMLRLTPLLGTITDPHFSTQDRMGRLATFMARQVQGPAGFRGIAVDDGVALAIDAHGIARRIGSAGGGSAYVVRGAEPTRLQAGQPLRYLGLRVRRLDRAVHRYDLGRNCGNTLAFDLDVDGANAPPYSVPPYSSGVAVDDCAEGR